MRKYFVVLFLWCLVGTVNAQVTYTPTVGNYTSVTDFASCPGGQTCTNFTTAMKQSGSFTVATALAANLANVNISGQVTAYSFSDGINTYSNTNPGDRIYSFLVTTNASGSITGSTILVEKWLSGTNGAHVIGDRFSYLHIGNQSVNNATCNGVRASPAGVADSCNADGGGTGNSRATSPAAVWTPVAAPTPTPVPTLSEWAMIIMTSLMALLAVKKLRRE